MPIRQRFRNPFKKSVIKPQEYEKLKDEAEAAKELLEDDRFQWFRNYLKEAQDSIIDQFVHNKIKAAETHTVVDNVLKVFKFPKKQQEDELSGQYKFIDKMITDFQGFATLPQKAEEASERGEVEIQYDGEKTTGKRKRV